MKIDNYPEIIIAWMNVKKCFAVKSQCYAVAVQARVISTVAVSSSKNFWSYACMACYVSGKNDMYDCMPFPWGNYSVYLSLQQTTSSYRVTGKDNWKMMFSCIFMATSSKYFTVDSSVIHSIQDVRLSINMGNCVPPL